MEEAQKYYQNSLSQAKEQLANIKSKRVGVALIRLAFFIGAIASLYFFYPNFLISAPVSLLCIIGFLIFVVRHNDLKRKTRFLTHLVEINEDEIKILEEDASHMASGAQFKDAEHEFANDIDLFGEGSFFQYANRTTIKEGTDDFVQVLLSNNIENISVKQRFIQDLAQRRSFRQEFQAYGKMVENEMKADEIVDWVSNYKPFLSKFHLILSFVFSAVSIGIVALTIMNVLPYSVINLWLVVGFLFIGIYLKRITKTANFANKIGDTFSQYAELAQSIEEQKFDYKLFPKNWNEDFLNAQSSKVLKSFSKKLDAVNNRNNLIVGIFGNGLFLRDFRAVYHLEKWIQENRSVVKDWFDLVHFLDAWNSFGTMAFNHQSFQYPEIKSEQSNILEAKLLGHPMLRQNQRVASDFSIQNNGFVIVTGANMAGKSTFLRTVALTVLMSNCGLPVCAETISYSPTKLISSMRTSDSLHNDESFFFSELKRLKFIVNHIEKEHYLILLDEILKGTNSVDKANGSAKFVQKLNKLNCTGIIATHDLSLCKLANEYEEISNLCFEAQIENDELSFDYKLKDGVCQNMNASFLLKKMDLVD